MQGKVQRRASQRTEEDDEINCVPKSRFETRQVLNCHRCYVRRFFYGESTSTGEVTSTGSIHGCIAGDEMAESGSLTIKPSVLISVTLWQITGLGEVARLGLR